MRLTTARMIQVEANHLVAAAERGEPAPLLISRLTAIIALCNTGIVTSGISIFKPRQDGEERKEAG